jgi:hypothetical protein
MAIISDQVMMLLPKTKKYFKYQKKENFSMKYFLTLHRSNFAIELFVKITFAWLNSTIILTVDNVLRRFCACGGRIETGTTSNH